MLNKVLFWYKIFSPLNSARFAKILGDPANPGAADNARSADNEAAAAAAIFFL